jgi:dTDP-4-amino-4,6-dideoxygalactose transaminase
VKELGIPFSRPTLAANSIEYVAAALESGLLSGDGSYSHRCESLLADLLDARRVFVTPSCTDALEMAALLSNIEPGDEVVVPSYTFTSTATAFALRGARLVFADSREDTLNIDERQLPGLVSERTRAVVVMHYGGIACEMDSIAELAATRGIDLIEDNAHGLGASYKGRKLGTFGRFGTQSFHSTKNISAGEGGAILVNDPDDLERAEIVREKGTDRSKFARGEVAKYTWVDEGSSYLPSEITAAVLLSQLERFDQIQIRRRGIWDRYMAGLTDWAAATGVQLPTVPEGCEQAYHVFYLLFGDQRERLEAQSALRQQGILAVTHYVPLHSSVHGRQVGVGECPVAESVSERLLRLPFYTDLGDDEVDRVIAVLEGTLR